MSSTNLTTLHELDDRLLELESHQLHTLLDGPTLIHLPGREEKPLFVSVLLHGNETTGWEALRALLKRYRGKTLPRALSFLIGNVQAAAKGMRHLPDQPDYNRIWTPGELPEQKMMQSIVEEMDRRDLFASIDIHNNTGRNPHYGCVNQLTPPYLHLASLFSTTVVYFTQPDGVQSMAMSNLCPAITVECGQPGQPHGVKHAIRLLDECLNLPEVPTNPLPPHAIHLFHTVATVKIPHHIEISFGGQKGDLCLHEDLDQLNFREIPAGTRFGQLCSDHLNHIEVWSESGEDVGDHFFEVKHGQLLTRRPVMPSMLTRDIEIIRQDCLCYLMERFTHSIS